MRWRLPNGADRQRRFGNKRQANAWLRSVEATHTQPIDTKAGRTTFAVVAREALAAKELKPNTLRGYERIVDERLLPTFGRVPIAKVERAAIEAWQQALPKRSANTTRNWLMVLSEVLRYAHRQGLIVVTQ